MSPDHIYSLYHVLAPDGLGYIGCTSKTVEERWHSHRPMAQYARGWPGYDQATFDDALKRFGKENFTITHIGCAMGPENAAAFETAAIAQYGTLKPNGYNRAARSNLKRVAVALPKPPKPTRNFIWIRAVPCPSWPPQARAA